MQSSPITSTPPTAFNIAGPNKKTIAEGIWNAGTVNAVNPNQLIVSANTLEFITGPTVEATVTTNPLIVNTNSASPAQMTGAMAHFVGSPGGDNQRLVLDSYGGSSTVTWRRADGSVSAPSAVQTGDYIGSFTAFGYGATGYGGERSAMAVVATENWTDTAQGCCQLFAATKNTTTAETNVMVVQGNGVGIGGNASIAPLVANAGTLQVVGGALLDQINVGTTSAVPSITAGSAAPTATLVAGSIYLRNDTTLGAHLYVSNGGGTWTAVALV